MHWLIDGQPLQSAQSRGRGIGRYAGNLVRALVHARPGWGIELVQSTALPPIPADRRHGLTVIPFTPPLAPHARNHEINERYYADWLTARGPDGVLVLHHVEDWSVVVPHFCGPRPRLLGIAYDLIPLLFPEHYLRDVTTTRWYAHRLRQLLGCDALLTISEATARDVRGLGGEDAPGAVNIGGAVDPWFAPLPPDELAVCVGGVRRRFGLRRDFLLCVGATDHRKNLRGAVRAFAGLPAGCRAGLDLAVVGHLPRECQAVVAEEAGRAGVGDSVRLLGTVTDAELRALYQTCRVFFFPSLYEGLGLPVLEALHCGAPVVTSNVSSLPEYAGAVSWQGDPTSPDDLARLLQEALAEPRDARRAEREQFARSLDWRRTAERASAVMEEVERRPRGGKRRLAWVSPLTEDAAGQTAHAAEVLPLLAERYDIELVTGPSRPVAPEHLTRDFLTLTAQEVAARHDALPYDLFVYQLSAAPRHRSLFDLSCRFPGLFVLRDASATERKQAWQWGARVVCHELWHDPRGAADAYADCIDRTIAAREEVDAPWMDAVVGCLAEHPERPDRVIDSWAALRTAGHEGRTWVK